MAMDLERATARDVARQYGQANGIRFMPEDNGFFDPDFRKLLPSILLNDVCNWIGKGNGALARAAIREMQQLFAVPRRPASPSVLVEWVRAYEAFAAQFEGRQPTPSEWPVAKVSTASKVRTMVIVPKDRQPRVRLYVTASPCWSGLRSGEWEPRPGRQNAPS
jgi:hypothetical protein